MKSSLPVTAVKTGTVALSAFFCLLGLLMIVDPESAASVLRPILGITLILFGAARLAGYFSRDLFRLAFEYDFSFGVLLVVLGIAVLLRSEGVIGFLRVLIGIVSLSDGIFKLRIATDAKRFGIKGWWVIAGFSAVTAAVGAFLLIEPERGVNALIVHMGIELFLAGLLNLTTILLSVKIARNQRAVPRTENGRRPPDFSK
ncbi:MAG: DUF308 domain-containing protein [Bacteroides sp.]|nr:DUF308 domain-containing protein [Eubacterium sp.]MCM1419639.1 DUF308 domain-containing protein [Roseburia sp.]MCM1463607.1 DUF308 domain-containing protein [Bacteroides sp.]